LHCIRLATPLLLRRLSCFLGTSARSSLLRPPLCPIVISDLSDILLASGHALDSTAFRNENTSLTKRHRLVLPHISSAHCLGFCYDLSQRFLYRHPLQAFWKLQDQAGLKLRHHPSSLRAKKRQAPVWRNRQ
jgi:hypothetical protein